MRVLPVAAMDPSDGTVRLILADETEATETAVTVEPRTKLTSAPEWFESVVSSVASVVISRLVSLVNFADSTVGWLTVSAVRTVPPVHHSVPSCPLVPSMAIQAL